MKSNPIRLATGDRRFLESFRIKGQHLAREVTRAHILSALDAKVPAAQIEQVLGVSRMVIWRTQSAYREKGLDYALYDDPRPVQPAKYSTHLQAEVRDLAGTQPPAATSTSTV